MPLQYSALHGTVCVEARGKDAAAFLHGQLTRAILELEHDHAPLAAWADARGRVRAVVRVCRLPERWLLLTPRDGVEELLKKLRMFVLRSNVTLAPAEDLAVAALLGHADDALARNDVPASTEPNRLVRRGDLGFIRIADACWLMFGPPSGLARVAATLDATTEAAAALAEIRLGIPAITPPVAEHFVAQMLNLDELRALSFDKGCYPGQEIIARVHNLGGVKRRARRYGMRAAVPAPATPVYSAEQAVGDVVRAAPTEAGCELLAVVDHAAVGAALTCGGTALVELPLPFNIPSD